MSDTYRTTFRGERVRDGQWCRRCYSANCNICVSGTEKYPARRRQRREARRQLGKIIPR